VFLRPDFRDLGGYDQVGLVLRGLVRKGHLLKVGYGIYTRAVKSPWGDEPERVCGPLSYPPRYVARLGTGAHGTRSARAGLPDSNRSRPRRGSTSTGSAARLKLPSPL
jgi:hypothetical protein